MTNTKSFSNPVTKISLILAVAMLMSLPTLTNAATYAYVNHSGEVNMHNSTSPSLAIQNAPNISKHSGVILLSLQGDFDIIGDNILGM